MHEKTNNLGFRPGLTQTVMYKHRRWLEAGKFGFRKKRNCTMRVAKTKGLISFAVTVAKTKALISFTVTAKLICAFVFAYANCRFCHAAAQIGRWLFTVLIVFFCLFLTLSVTLESHHKKIGFLPLRKQKRRSASQCLRT